MISMRHDEAQHHLRIHRLAVKLYESLVARHGIHHEQAELALRLVEATNPEGSAVAVPCVGLCPEQPDRRLSPQAPETSCGHP